MAKSLSLKLKLPHISRDNISEWIVEATQDFDSSIKSKIACTGYDLMFRMAGELSKGGGSFIVEGCINPDFGGKRLVDEISGASHEIFEIFVTAADEILLDRYFRRAGTPFRHIAHGEEASRVEELRKHLKEANYRPARVGKFLLEIDNGMTSNEETFKYLIESIKKNVPGFIKDGNLIERDMVKASSI